MATNHIITATQWAMMATNHDNDGHNNLYIMAITVMLCGHQCLWPSFYRLINHLTLSTVISAAAAGDSLTEFSSICFLFTTNGCCCCCCSVPDPVSSMSSPSIGGCHIIWFCQQQLICNRILTWHHNSWKHSFLNFL